MAKKPESRLQRQIRAGLERKFQARFFKVHGSEFMEAGLPDLVGCVEGYFFGFEVKTDEGDPSEIQLETLAEFRDAGGCACVVRSLAEAIAVVQATLQLAKEGRRLRVEPKGGRAILRPTHRKNVDYPRNHGTTFTTGSPRRRPTYK